MKISMYSFKSALLGTTCLLTGFGAQLMAQSSPTVAQTFTYTGAVQQFTVPPCVGSMTILAMGASGGTGGSGGSSGSNGGLVRGVMTATPGQVMYFYVGGQGSVTAGGFNGGGAGGASSSSQGAGGGGASDVRIGGTAFSNRILVAGAGGGGGGSSTYAPISGAGGGGSSFSSASGFGGGAAGGCAVGAAGGESGGTTSSSYGAGGSGGGYISGGGGGGQPSASTGGYGCNGTLGTGGAGGGTSFICGGATGGVNGGGGGGGGYYGGGGGMTGTGGCNGGGGGGSSWAQTPMFSGITYTSGVTNTVTGHGFISIIYAFNGSLTTATITPFAICQGQTATITAGGSSTYTWSTASNSNVITVNPTSNTTYTVTGTNSIGCVSNAVVTVTVSSGSPVLSVASSTNQICLGKTVTLTASGALTYTWTGGVTNGLAYSPSVTSNYTVLGQNGCGTTSAVTTVTVAPLAVSVLSTPTAVCAGGSATLTAASAGTSYTWQPFSLPGASVVVSPNATTVYTVSTSDGTCSGVANLTLVANPIPTLSAFISNTNICQGAAITLSASGANGYTWSPGNLTGSIITVTPNAPTQYSVVGNNSIGCLGGAGQIVIVSPSPTLVVNASNPIVCSGGSSTLNVSGADNYAWSTSATANSIVVNPTSSTNYTVAGTFTSGPGCSSNTVISVGVFVPTLAVTGATSTCVGNPVNLNASSAGTWLWSNGATSQAVQVTPNTTTVYSVTALTTSGSINCPASASIQVTVYQNPTLTATSSRSVMCKGENNTLSVSGASTYTWSTGATTTSVAITPSLVTTLTYSINGTSGNGCLGTTSLQVKVNACTGIDQVNVAKTPVLIYPNPSNGEINLTSQTDMKLVIVNELGQVVKSLTLDQSNDRAVLIKDLAKGVYFVVSQNSSDLVRERIVILK